MRARLVATFAIAVASCVAISLYRNADAQAAPLLRPSSFPPRPADILNLDGLTNVPGIQSIEVVLYIVPAARWLVVTDWQLRGPTNPGTQLIERTASGDVVKAGTRFIGDLQFDRAIRQSAIGYSFKPGSSVVLRLDNSNESNQWDSYWNLIGYLAN